MEQLSRVLHSELEVLNKGEGWTTDNKLVKTTHGGAIFGKFACLTNK